MRQDVNDTTTSDPSHLRWWWVVAAVLIVALAIVVWVRRRPVPTTGLSASHGDERKAPEGTGASADTFEVEPETQRAVGLATEPARQEVIAEKIETTAAVGPDETRVARVRPLAEGRVLRVAVRVGDHVGAGQMLLAYDSITAGQLMSDYRGAVAALDRATAEADVGRRSLERADNLVEMGAVARSERDRRSAEHQRALGDVHAADAAVKNVEQKLRRLGTSVEDLARVRNGNDPSPASLSAVSAPFAGVVLEVHAAPGEVMTPERELFIIADLSRVWVQGDVYQKDIGRIRIGQDAAVTVDTYPGETFTGKVTHISDVLDPDTRTAKVRCEVVNPAGRLKFQMFATLALPVSDRRRALLIPSRAIQDIDGVPTVFVRVGEKQFTTRAVRVAATIGDVVEITEGLKVGEPVVTDGALMLKSRLKLRVEDEK